MDMETPNYVSSVKSYVLVEAESLENYFFCIDGKLKRETEQYFQINDICNDGLEVFSSCNLHAVIKRWFRSALECF